MMQRKGKASSSTRFRLGFRTRFAAAILALPVAIGICGLQGYRINITASEPLGLWRILPLHRSAAIGDLVFLCPPQTPVMQRAQERHYLRPGLCPGGVAPLIKSVVAISGQRIDVGKAVRIDGALLANSELAAIDGHGRALIPYAGGVVPEGEVFVHSPYRASFDSRYFGPVPAAGVLGLANEVATYAP
jgi:conjugative transfer signal peptidase TraF